MDDSNETPGTVIIETDCGGVWLMDSTLTATTGEAARFGYRLANSIGRPVRVTWTDAQGGQRVCRPAVH